MCSKFQLCNLLVCDISRAVKTLLTNIRQSNFGSKKKKKEREKENSGIIYCSPSMVISRKHL